MTKQEAKNMADLANDDKGPGDGAERERGATPAAEPERKPEAAANAGPAEPAADKPAKPTKAELPDLMRCPFCKELVLSNIGTCPGCGEPIVPGLLVPGMMHSESPRRGRGCMLFFLFCMGFFAVLGFFVLRMAMQPPKPRVEMPGRVGQVVIAVHTGTVAGQTLPLPRRG